MLTVRDLHVRFGQAHILQGVSLELGEAPLAILGRNGMGKTTLCGAISGLVAASEGEITLDGARLSGLAPYRIARRGVALVPQGRRTFPSLSVHEHLRLVAQRGGRWTIPRIYETFPRLAERRNNGGTELSGGEQQMLAISRALLMNPKVIVMDEPSEGLAPVIVDHLIGVLRDLPKDGMRLLLVEQNLRVATEVAAHVAIMVTGRIAATMPARALAEDTETQRRYLGVAVGGHH
ncbi:ABC transporter ATP-binding protein [Roseococcus suduntuyensis]|uniref:Branched-chain amino acid transport system ATP-binding protein n=1 Tax=Roseococcus suduntuyensis TaxID=455361 RepID=A0A840AHD3_9PROT|nr:ABC transporter ATP-binding protein [Roseococcus suduntuyensis]MBB3899956.1 branched-chain amino acid transport system ATP-binding protein [Roseococcus suduntuyensis]